jgi:hypothetical protein
MRAVAISVSPEPDRTGAERPLLGIVRMDRLLESDFGHEIDESDR